MKILHRSRKGVGKGWVFNSIGVLVFFFLLPGSQLPTLVNRLKSNSGRLQLARQGVWLQTVLQTWRPWPFTTDLYSGMCVLCCSLYLAVQKHRCFCWMKLKRSSISPCFLTINLNMAPIYDITCWRFLHSFDSC